MAKNIVLKSIQYGREEFISSNSLQKWLLTLENSALRQEDKERGAIQSELLAGMRKQIEELKD